MIYLGHKEVWPPSRILHEQFLESQQKRNSELRHALEVIDVPEEIARLQYEQEQDRLWKQIFHSGD